MKINKTLSALVLAFAMLLGIGAATLPANAAVPAVSSNTFPTISTAGCGVGPSSHIHGTFTVLAVNLPYYKRRLYGSMTSYYQQEVTGPNIYWHPYSITFHSINGLRWTRYTNSSIPRAYVDIADYGRVVQATFTWHGTRAWDKLHTASCTTSYIQY